MRVDRLPLLRSWFTRSGKIDSYQCGRIAPARFFCNSLRLRAPDPLFNPPPTVVVTRARRRPPPHISTPPPPPLFLLSFPIAWSTSLLPSLPPAVQSSLSSRPRYRLTTKNERGPPPRPHRLYIGSPQLHEQGARSQTRREGNGAHSPEVHCRRAHERIQSQEVRVEDPVHVHARVRGGLWAHGSRQSHLQPEVL